MNTRTERDKFGEIGIVEFQGKEFAARGASIVGDRAVAYCSKGGVLTEWAGKPIGTWHAVTSWRLPLTAWISDRMYQIEAVIDGRVYTGRGCGEGMVWRGRLKKGR